MNKFILEIAVNGHFAVCVNPTELPANQTKWIDAHFTFSPEWSGLIKNVVFSGSSTTRVVLNAGDTVVVPWECCTEIGANLMVGVNGHSADGTINLPTLWAYCGTIKKSVDDDATEAAPPTPSQIAQIETAITALQTGKQAKLTAGENITIATDGTISASAYNDTELRTMIAGKANTVHGHVISDIENLDTVLDSIGDSVGDLETGKQNKLTAGENITIATDGTISANVTECEFFAAVVGTTTFSEIQQELFVKRKIVVAHDGTGNPTSGFIPLAGMDANGFKFLKTWIVDPPVVFYTTYYCNANGWTSSTVRVPYIQGGESVTLLNNASTTATTGKVYASNDDVASIDTRVTALEESAPAWSDITGKPTTFAPSAHEHVVDEISDFPSIPHDTIELDNSAGYITAADIPPIPTVTNDFTNDYKNKVDTLWSDYQTALALI